MTKAKTKGLRPKVVECELCGDLVTVPVRGMVPKFCAKHRKNGARLLARKTKKAITAKPDTAAPGAAAAAAPGRSLTAPTGNAIWTGGGRMPKGWVRPTSIACEVCGDAVPVAAKAMIPRFCKKHRNNKNSARRALTLPTSRPAAAAPARAAAAPTGRRASKRTFELTRQALRFAGLHIVRSMDTSEGVMLLVRTVREGDA